MNDDEDYDLVLDVADADEKREIVSKPHYQPTTNIFEES